MKKPTRDVQDYLNLGERAYLSQDYKLAISQFNMAKKINQQTVKNHCDKIISSNSNHVVALIIRADIFENIGNYAAALKDYDAALEILPKNNPLYKYCKEERDLIKEKAAKANDSANKKHKLQTVKITSPSKKSKNTFTRINRQLFSSPQEEVMPLEPSQKASLDNNNQPTTVSSKHTDKKKNRVAVETIVLNSFKITPMSKLSKKEFSSALNTKSRKKQEKTAEEMEAKEEKNKAIGRWGESFVYLKLKSDYEIKYNNIENYENFSAKEIQIEQQNGVIDKQFTISCSSCKTKERITLILNWHNFGEESYKSKDITITKWVGGRSSTERVIEVKATESPTPWNAKFSKEEIEQMQQYREHYRIFRVYSARQKSATIQKLKNPYEQIFPAASKEKSNHQPKVAISKIKLRI